MPKGVRIRVSPPLDKEKPTFRSWLFYSGQTNRDFGFIAEGATSKVIFSL